VTTVAFALAFGLRTEFVLSDAHWLALVVGAPVVAVVSLFAYHAVGLFRGTWSQTADADLIVVIKGASLVSLLLIAGLVFSDILEQIPRSVPLIHWFITVVALYGSRLLWAKFRAAAESGHKGVALLVGCDQSALRFLTSVQTLASAKLKIFGLLETSVGSSRVGRTIRGTPVIGRVDRVEECLAQLGVHGVFPERFVVMDSFRQNAPGRFASLEAAAKSADIALDVINDSIWLDDGIEDLPTEPSAEAKPLLSARRYLRFRRPIEWLVAMTMVTLLSPIFVLLSFLCWCDVGRPIFFWQMRPGRYMKPIRLVKFRTMRDGFDADGKPLSDEERTSAIGRLIRRSKLDELPQLFAIIKGDMSFIGPRPLLPRDQAEDARLRAIVRPGVTGWAQVNGGHPLEIEEKFALDIWYIQNASLWLDIKVLLLTVRTVLFGDRVDRAAIETAMATRELLRPAAQRLDVTVGQPAASDQTGKPAAKTPEDGWWKRPVGTLDQAS
jgi:lipopolysaccharide/colanic/teichoic acid biosynthesis glycosyltransferase